MALWVCENPECRTLYAVRLFGGCPHCRHPEFHEFGSKPEDEEHPMAKISRHGGATNTGEQGEGDVPRADDQPQPAAPADIPVTDTSTAPVTDTETEPDTDDEGEEGEGAGDVASDEDEPSEAGPAGVVANPRPSVNDPKPDWVAYFSFQYNVDPEVVDDGYTKRGIIDAVGKLEAGTHLLGADGQLVDVTSPG